MIEIVYTIIHYSFDGFKSGAGVQKVSTLLQSGYAVCRTTSQPGCYTSSRGGGTVSIRVVRCWLSDTGFT
jgi:hypothetical protein